MYLLWYDVFMLFCSIDEYRDLLDDTMEDIRAEMRGRFVAMEEQLLPNIRSYRGRGDQLVAVLDDNVRSLQLYIKEQVAPKPYQKH